MKKAFRIALRLLVVLALWSVSLLVLLNLETAGLIDEEAVLIFYGAWGITAVYSCFPSLCIPNRS